MLVRNLLRIILATSVTVKSDDDVCEISSDFTTSLFSGLINNYKYKEVETAIKLIKDLYLTIDKFDKFFYNALHNNYDDYILDFGYYTNKIEMDMGAALNATDEMNADKDHPVVRSIASLIKAERYDEAVSQTTRLANEILIYKIVEVTYTSERKNHAFNKLLKFSYNILESKTNVSLAIAVVVSMFKELSEDPANFYTREMVSFAELVKETIQKYYEYYRDDPEFAENNKRLTFIQISLPEQIQRLVFLKGFKFDAYMCFKNLYWEERLFVGDFHYDNDPNRRIAYVSNENIALANQQWNVYYNSTKQGYIIRSALYDEYLHNAEDGILWNPKNRFVFTKKKETDPLKGYWSFVPIDVKHFAIKNVYDNEFIWVPDDRTFTQTYHKSRVFSYKVHGEFKVLEENGEYWILEEC